MVVEGRGGIEKPLESSVSPGGGGGAGNDTAGGQGGKVAGNTHEGRPGGKKWSDNPIKGAWWRCANHLSPPGRAGYLAVKGITA